MFDFESETRSIASAMSEGTAALEAPLEICTLEDGRTLAFRRYGAPTNAASIAVSISMELQVLVARLSC
jgi:hypothetical protein